MIFISYDFDDKVAALEIVGFLEERRMRCFLAHRDQPAIWLEWIVERLNDCRACIVVMSPKTSQSLWVKREVAAAISNGLEVIGYLSEDFEPTDWLGFTTLTIQRIRASDPNRFPILERTIRQLAGQSGQDHLRYPPEITKCGLEFVLVPPVEVRNPFLSPFSPRSMLRNPKPFYAAKSAQHGSLSVAKIKATLTKHNESLDRLQDDFRMELPWWDQWLFTALAGHLGFKQMQAPRFAGRESALGLTDSTNGGGECCRSDEDGYEIVHLDEKFGLLNCSRGHIDNHGFEYPNLGFRPVLSAIKELTSPCWVNRRIS